MKTKPYSDDQCFKIYANCIPVKGANRSVICDLQRRRFDFIPNEFYDFIMEYEGAQIKKIKADFDQKSHQVIDEYFDFLKQKNYLFFCSEEEVNWFPKLDIEWKTPSLIENAIIDINQESNHNYHSIVDQLEALGCRAIEFRFFNTINYNEVIQLLSLFKTRTIENINLILPYSPEFNKKTTEQLILNFPRLTAIFLHSFPTDKNAKLLKLNDKTSEKVVFITQVIDSSSHCGFISPYSFRINIKSFSESQLHNNCLNKKISVDINGEIKNCPSLPDSYGNIKTTTFEEALSNEGFKKLWDITKDQIAICKVCEFRYICSDCRAYTQDQNDIYSKPEKCSYNPETTRWE